MTTAFHWKVHSEGQVSASARCYGRMKTRVTQSRHLVVQPLGLCKSMTFSHCILRALMFVDFSSVLYCVMVAFNDDCKNYNEKGSRAIA